MKIPFIALVLCGVLTAQAQNSSTLAGGASETSRAIVASEDYVSVAEFGAKGDGVTDDAAAIEAALNSPKNIVFEGKTYLIKKVVEVRDLKSKRIQLGSATIVKSTYDIGGFQFARCTDLVIEGGTLTCAITPKESSNGDAHGFQFIGCTNLTLRDTYIAGSGQMGVCIMGCIDVLMEHNKVENTYRDGIYSHYSAYVRYLNNRMSNIKDDALSMHDYGLVVQKPEVIAANLKQAGNSIISGNMVHNAYQGISSIGCDRVLISNNIVDSTVNAGIAVFNHDKMFVGTEAKVRNVVISNNIVINAGKSTKIMDKIYETNPPFNTARGSICVQSQGDDDKYTSATRRLTNITVSGNSVSEGGTEGIFCGSIDNLTITGNSVVNCNIGQLKSTENVLEIYECNDFLMVGNNIVDDRETILHGRGYSIEGSRGVVNANSVSGFVIEAFQTGDSKINP